MWWFSETDRPPWHSGSTQKWESLTHFLLDELAAARISFASLPGYMRRHLRGEYPYRPMSAEERAAYWRAREADGGR